MGTEYESGTASDLVKVELSMGGDLLITTRRSGTARGTYRVSLRGVDLMAYHMTLTE